MIKTAFQGQARDGKKVSRPDRCYFKNLIKKKLDTIYCEHHVCGFKGVRGGRGRGEGGGVRMEKK